MSHYGWNPNSPNRRRSFDRVSAALGEDEITPQDEAQAKETAQRHTIASAIKTFTRPQPARKEP